MRLLCYPILFSPIFIPLIGCSNVCEIEESYNNGSAISRDHLTKQLVRKCCSFGEYIEVNDFSCTGPSDSEFVVSAYNEHQFVCKLQDKRVFSIGEISCKSFLYAPEDFVFQSNGTIWLPDHGRFATQSEYCVDYLEDDPEFLVADICQTSGELILDKVTDIAVAIALVFLIATTVAYICLPDRSLHIKAHICYLIALTLSTSLEVTTQFTEPRKEVCIFIGYAEYFLSLSYMYWLNVIAINMWRTFGGKFLDSRLDRGETRQFVIYNLCVWGIALLQTIIIIVVDMLIEVRTSDFNPGILEGKCFFTSAIAMIIYYQVPQGISVAANIVIFIRTSLKIREGQKGSFKGNDSRRHQKIQSEQKTVTIYIRLLLTMGVNWVLDLILWLIYLLWDSPAHYEEYIWYFIKLHNAAYGVALFFIFICKKRVLDQLKARFCKKALPTRGAGTTSSMRTTEEQLSSSTRGF